MIPKIAGGLTLATLVVSATLAGAQVSTNKVAEEQEWSVFVESDPDACWGVSAPTATVNTRDGREVAVRRGDIRLFVSIRPEDEVQGEVSFTGGYPFAEESQVELEIGDDAYQLFTEGEWAWPVSPEQDTEIIASMKRGAEAVLTGRSSRGTQTRDTFSLMGFTAALEAAQARCDG